MNIAFIFGGKSAEFEVSLVSATNIINTMDRERFTPLLIGVDKQGEWFYNAQYANQSVDLTARDYFADAEPVCLTFPSGTLVPLSTGRMERTVRCRAS